MTDNYDNHEKRASTQTRDEFTQQVGTAFKQQAEELDAATLSRLNQARQTALSKRRGPVGTGWFSGWAPVAGVAVACAVVTVLLLTEPADISPVLDPPVAAAFEVGDLDVLMAEESLEMLEDLEFYTWLDFDDAELLLLDGMVPSDVS